ncbi:MAG: hypothetical protein Q9195_007869 [Heterodermia aff. obscurata]
MGPQHLRTPSGHTAPIISFDVSFTHMATICLDETLRIWDTQTGELRYMLKTNDTTVCSKFRNGELYRTLHGHNTTVTSVTIEKLRGTGAIVSASSDGEVRMRAYQSILSRPEPDGEAIVFPRPMRIRFVSVILVFYLQPILDIALGGKGLALKPISPKELLEVLDYKYLTNTAMKHINSFIDKPISEFSQMIAEIVHYGLGLRYNTSRGTAVNPENRSPILDPEVLLASRPNRAMIEQKDVEPAAEVQKQRKERDNKAEVMKTDLQTNLQREKEKKRKWWKKF